MKEKWKKITGFEGLYEVSSLGRVRTLERIILRKTKLGNYKPFGIKEKIKIANHSNNGYLTIALVKSNKTYNTLLHRIIAEAFVKGKTIDKCVVNHKNGIKIDNRIENLEWVTSSFNNTHALDNFLRSARKDVHIDFINNVLHLRSRGYTIKNIANELNSSITRIQGITSGRTYRRLQLKHNIKH